MKGLHHGLATESFASVIPNSPFHRENQSPGSSEEPGSAWSLPPHIQSPRLSQ